MSKTVVILGGSYAGLHIAHYLLKNTKEAKVVVVSKNSHFYWNIATVRAVVPGGFKDEQVFGSLETALGRYPKERVELIIGAATAVDFAAKTVTAQPGGGAASRSLAYDELVLATGSRNAAPDVPWKANGTYEEAVALLHKTQDRVGAAKHIVVAGAGSTGVETAAELGWAYGAPADDKDRKEVVLLSAGPEVLGGDVVAGSALAELKKLHVSVKASVTVKQNSTLPDGKTELTLSNGEKLLTDLYLPTFGLVPNSEYLDGQYLNEKKNVIIDEFHRVRGAEHVWAAGDIVSLPRAGFMITKAQATGVSKNVAMALQGKAPAVVKPPLDIFAVSTGRGRGVGRVGASVRLLSIMVWMAKGRTLATQMLAGYIDGSVA